MKNKIKMQVATLFVFLCGMFLGGCDNSQSNRVGEEINHSDDSQVSVQMARTEIMGDPKPVEVVDSAAEMISVAPVVDDSDAFISERGGFKIVLPDGFPEFVLEEGETDDSDGGSLTYVSEKHGRAGCMVMVNSNAGWANAVAKVSLDAVRDGNVNCNPENILEKEEDFTFNGFPGRRIFIKQQSGRGAYFIRYDIALVETRLYQVMYLSTRKSELDDPQVKSYFDSFRLIAASE